MNKKKYKQQKTTLSIFKTLQINHNFPMIFNSCIIFFSKLDDFAGEFPSLMPPEVTIDEEKLKQLEAEVRYIYS